MLTHIKYVHVKGLSKCCEAFFKIPLVNIDLNLSNGDLPAKMLQICLGF